MSFEGPPIPPEDWLSPSGSLPGDDPEPTPEELEALAATQAKKNEIDNKLAGFVDFNEIPELKREQKLKLVQNICERFVFGHLSGMNGTIGFSDTLRPEIKDKDLVAKYRYLATNLWRQAARLPYQMKDKDISWLLNVGSTNKQTGERLFFESIIKPPKQEPNQKNPYLTQEAFAFHDARMLDFLIKELYLQPHKYITGFSKN